VRDRAPGLHVVMMRRKAESAGGDRLYELSTKTSALSQTCLCGNRKKKPLSQRVHRCECGIKEDRDLLRLTWDCTSTKGLMVSTGWTWRQPTNAGCSTVTTLMGAEVQPQQYPTGEAADIRRRGGQWRVSRPAGPRSDRAGRRELLLPTGPRRCPHEQRDSRLAQGIPAVPPRGGRQRQPVRTRRLRRAA
jgi:hypothetical protein